MSGKFSLRLVDPCALQFKLLATRRYMLDNELTLSEFIPGAVSRPSLQNAWMPYCTTPPSISFENGTVVFLENNGQAVGGVLFVGAFFPGIHFTADVQTLSDGSAALMDIAPYDGSFRLRVRAEPNRPVEFEETLNRQRLDAKIRLSDACRQSSGGPSDDDLTVWRQRRADRAFQISGELFLTDIRLVGESHGGQKSNRVVFVHGQKDGGAGDDSR